MRVQVVLVILTATTACVAAAKSTTYTSKFDSIDIERVLNNSRILTQYINCLLDMGSCTSEGRELKRLLPDALKTACGKCSEKQKSAAEKTVRFLKKNRSKEWERLVAKYDPKGEAQTKFASLAMSSS